MSLQFNMSEQNLPNGLPPNFASNNAVPLNGVESLQSSPVHRINQIPASQLPPTRSAISTNQENVKQITHNYSNLNISQVTPMSSPKGQNFSTSTPNTQLNSEKVRNLNQFDSNKLSGLANISRESNNLKQDATKLNNDVLTNHQTFKEVPLGVPSSQSVKNNNLPYSTHNSVQQGTLENLKLGLKLQDEEYQKLRQNTEEKNSVDVVEEVSLSKKSAFQAVQQHNLFDDVLNEAQAKQKVLGSENLFNSKESSSFMQPSTGLQQQKGQQQANLKTDGRDLQQQPSPRSQFQQQPSSVSQFQLDPSPRAQFQQHPPPGAQFQPQLPQRAPFQQQPPLGAQFQQQPPSSAQFRQPAASGQIRSGLHNAGQAVPILQQEQTHQGFSRNVQQQVSLNTAPLSALPPQQQQGLSSSAPLFTPSQQKLTQHTNANVSSFPPHQQPPFGPPVNSQQQHSQGFSQKVPLSAELQPTKVPQYFQPQQHAAPPPFLPKAPANLQQQQQQNLPPKPQGIVQQQPISTNSQNLPPLRPLYNFQQASQPELNGPATQNSNQPQAMPSQINRSQQVPARLPYQQQPQPPPSDQNPLYKTSLHANRYPAPQQQFQSNTNQFTNAPSLPQPAPQTQPDPYAYYNKPNVVQSGFSKLWGHENLDLLEHSHVLPPTRVEPPRISLGQEFLDAANCSPDIFRCTMTKIPESNTLLQKSRLPLGVLIHPFKDLDHLPVIQCNNIVRCRACRTYINPFVFFIDMKRWKCNLCYRVNELPEEFQFDPVSKTFGDPSRRPEIKSSTIEYIAPSEYMLRPPQPAVYLFLLDVSHAAIESGYLKIFCDVLADNLASMPGDGRTQIGFIAYNSAIHFYSFADGLNRPHEMTILDIDDVFLPCPDNLLVNLNERKEMILDLLQELPNRFSNSYDTGSALGSALQIAHKLITSTGGRVTVFQSSLPNCGPGLLTAREDPNQRSGIEVHHLNPANDFYKRLALECSGQQIAVDLFILNSQYVDLATISGISKFSGGCIHHYPLFKASRVVQAESLERCLKRYLTRKIGFEAVMRIRCTRGLSIHTFHGNFFVRSTDLLSLPNVNPEAGFGMQVAIDESLSDLHTVCFQAALLYTSSKGERRIRVHTLCLPITSTLPEVLAAADQQCIVGLLAKMAVDRSTQSSLVDSREAFINVAIDILSSYKLSLNLGSSSGGLVVSHAIKLLPLYISALLKHLAFRTGTSTRLDDRVKAMCDMKTLPLYLLIQQIYPDLYPIHNLEDQITTLNVDGDPIPQPPRLQLSARCLDSKGAFLMDTGERMMIFVGPNAPLTFLNDALGLPDYNSISEQMYDLPILNTPQNLRLNNFINYLNDEKPFPASLHIIRENSQHRNVFLERLVEDRVETALSYHEFLQHLKTQVK